MKHWLTSLGRPLKHWLTSLANESRHGALLSDRRGVRLLAQRAGDGADDIDLQVLLTVTAHSEQAADWSTDNEIWEDIMPTYLQT